jgi:hypothetical protein
MHTQAVTRRLMAVSAPDRRVRAGSAPTRRVLAVMDDIERGAIPAEGLDPNNSAAVAALALVELVELGRADSNLGRQRGGADAMHTEPV